MRKIFYVLLTLGFIFLWFRLVDLKEAALAIENVKWSFVLIAIVLALANSLFGALRLKTLLSVISDIPVSYIWGLGYTTSLISLLFPFYLGGLSFAYFIAKKIKSSYAKAFSLIFIDFFIGVLIISLLAVLAFFYFSKKNLLVLNPNVFNNQIGLFLLAVALAFIGAVVLKPKLKIFENLLKRIKRGILLFNKKIVLKVVILTFIMLVLGTSSSYLYYLAFKMRPPIVDFLLASSLFGLLSMIPGAPTKIGQYETFGVLTLPFLLNLDKNAVFAVLVVSHAISIFTTSALGVFSLYYLKIDREVLKNISKAVYLKAKGPEA